MVDVVLGDPRVLQRRGEGLSGQGHVELLPESLLPDVRVHLSGDAPTVEELVATGATPDELGHASLGTAEEAGGAVTAVALLGRAGETGTKVRDDGKGAAATRSAAEGPEQRGHRRPGRARQVVGPALPPQPECCVHSGGAGLIEIRGVGCRQEHVVDGGGRGPTRWRRRVRRRPRRGSRLSPIPGCGAQGPPPGLHGERRRVLVVGGDRSRPPTAAAAQHPGDGRPLEPPCGQVRAPRHDAAAHDAFTVTQSQPVSSGALCRSPKASRQHRFSDSRVTFQCTAAPWPDPLPRSAR